MFNTKHIFTWWMFHCHVRLVEASWCSKRFCRFRYCYSTKRWWQEFISVYRLCKFQLYSWTFPRVPNRSYNVSIHHPSGFNWHPRCWLTNAVPCKHNIGVSDMLTSCNSWDPVEEILHQLRWVVFPIVYDAFLTPKVAFSPDELHQQWRSSPNNAKFGGKVFHLKKNSSSNLGIIALPIN